jgi:hypothetical protein
VPEPAPAPEEVEAPTLPKVSKINFFNVSDPGNGDITINGLLVKKDQIMLSVNDDTLDIIFNASPSSTVDDVKFINAESNEIIVDNADIYQTLAKASTDLKSFECGTPTDKDAIRTSILSVLHRVLLTESVEGGSAQKKRASRRASKRRSSRRRSSKRRTSRRRM